MGQKSPQKVIIRRIFLMRLAFILLLVGNGIALFTSLASTFYSLSLHLGEDEFQFFQRIRLLSNILTEVSMGSLISGGIILLIGLVRVGYKGSFKLKGYSKLASIFLLISLVLNFAFTYVLASLELWGVLTSATIATILGYTPLITIAVDSTTYILLGFTIRQLKNDYGFDNRPLITTFVYPITFALRLLLLFNIFPSMIAELIASLVITITSLVILIVFYFTALVGVKKVKNKLEGIKSSIVLPSSRKGKFCANCGAPLDSIGSFCANCGHPK